MVPRPYHVLPGRTADVAILAVAACLSLYLYIRPALRDRPVQRKFVTSGARESSTQAASHPQTVDGLPYAPDVFPGGREVESEYGTIKVFEWGPEAGEKVLLMHGIGTPCIALGDMAKEFVRRGCRVMLFGESLPPNYLSLYLPTYLPTSLLSKLALAVFSLHWLPRPVSETAPPPPPEGWLLMRADFFGRGYSDAPVDLPYDERLYTSQILLVLASSGLSWTGSSAFHLVGYSLGGALAASFAAYHANILRSLTLVCPGGLVRSSHVGLLSRLLYSGRLLPNCLTMALVRRRLDPKRGSNADVPEGDDADVDVDFDQVSISCENPAVKVGHVVRWQLAENEGFAEAYLSTVRNAPIYGQHDGPWRRLAEQLSSRRRARAGAETPAGLEAGRICLILAENDPIVVAEEWIEDARKVLGEDGVVAHVLKGGHEIAISRGRDVADVAFAAWNGKDESRL
ncbi:alpha/beta hydrolase [Drechmeria coniospora]|uniref:Alpha/beta hydrolase n=1 Tax=Drechmeria coniospora TaxID=98403 RepID=A0A151GMW3_DRECN|nr:alpha/beta hydrolase [Drechmeria coniospora]KYK58430.1 alpha/beta hydrolase [Drechmeria coniospora]